MGSTTASAERRVARGAKFLDERVPNWEQRINLERLDISSDTDCVLGQLFGTYVESFGKTPLSNDQDLEFGFYTTEYAEEEQDDDFLLLTMYWKREALIRLNRRSTGVITETSDVGEPELVLA